jgi:hypothetical protein
MAMSVVLGAKLLASTVSIGNPALRVRASLINDSIKIEMNEMDLRENSIDSQNKSQLVVLEEFAQFDGSVSINIPDNLLVLLDSDVIEYINQTVADFNQRLEYQRELIKFIDNNQMQSLVKKVDSHNSQDLHYNNNIEQYASRLWENCRVTSWGLFGWGKRIELSYQDSMDYQIRLSEAMLWMGIGSFLALFAGPAGAILGAIAALATSWLSWISAQLSVKTTNFGAILSTYLGIPESVYSR